MQRHFTATAFIIDSQDRTLLIHHKRLDRWMPPGGHMDPDETPEEAARRECKEETGLDVEILGREEVASCKVAKLQDRKLIATDSQETWNLEPANLELVPNLFASSPSEGQMLKTPIAMLLENIPACPERNEGEHQHMDFLFVARPLDETQQVLLQEEEGHEIRWFTREEVQNLGTEKDIYANVQAYILHLLPEK